MDKEELDIRFRLWMLKQMVENYSKKRMPTPFMDSESINGTNNFKVEHEIKIEYNKLEEIEKEIPEIPEIIGEIMIEIMKITGEEDE